MGSETIDQRSIWDAAYPGGPCPPFHGQPLCGLDDDGRLDPAGIDPFTGFGCNRQRGHRGQHVALIPRRVVATWPQEAL